MKRTADFMDRVQKLMNDINEILALHDGSVSLEKVDGGTIYVKLSGGCQGCAAAHNTLQMGILGYLQNNMDGVEEIIDVTNHDEGKNPYYQVVKECSNMQNKS